MQEEQGLSRTTFWRGQKHHIGVVPNEVARIIGLAAFVVSVDKVRAVRWCREPEQQLRQQMVGLRQRMMLAEDEVLVQEE